MSQSVCISATALPEVLQLLNMDTGEVVVTGDITALAGHHRVCTPPEVCRTSIFVLVHCVICNIYSEACRVCRTDVLG